MIYFDQAATSLLKPNTVTHAVCQAIQTAGNPSRGAHGPALNAARIVYEARENLAYFFGVEDCSRLAFTSNATESLNIAIKGLLSPGDHVITTQIEHNSVLRPLYEMEQKGVELSIVPCDEQGVIEAASVEQYIKDNTKVVICTHSSNVTGNVIDIQVIGEICRRHQLTFIVDAAQTAGVFPINVRKQNIDVLCFTGHKGLLGPQGIGGIYVREGIALRPLKSGGSGVLSFERGHPVTMPEALEAGTLNVPGIAGVNAGVTYLMQKGVDTIREIEQGLAWQFYEGVRSMRGVQVYGDFSGSDRSAIVTITLSNLDSSSVSDLLGRQYGICTRAGAHCAPLVHEALGTDESGAVRFSFSHLNTREEVQTAVNAICELVHQ